MAVSSFLVFLSLVLSAQSWPQRPFDPEQLGDLITLPVIPYSSVSARSPTVADDEIEPAGTSPVSQRSRRRSPEHDIEDMPFHILPIGHVERSILDKDATSGMTLPIPQQPRRSDKDKPFHIQPFDGKRSLPADDIPSGMLMLPVIHAERLALAKRAVEVQVENRSDVSYYAQLNIGTPPQKVYAQIDTGSFELWVNPDCTQVSTADQNFCRAVGRYDPSSSSTSDVTKTTASLKYGIGEANVTYVLDTIALPGSPPMKQVQFGVATASKDEFSGILGIGHGLGFNTKYRNFIDELEAQGVTKTKAFSLALGSKDEKEGVIIFGGVDTAKFQGKLAQLPIVPAADSPDGVARYWVSLKAISLSPPGGKSTTFANTTQTVFLDSGATLTLLPPAVVGNIAQSLGSSQLDNYGFYTVDCGLVDQAGSLDFAFDGVTIEVPYKEMIRQINTLPPRCYLGMMPSNDFALLGDTFMRSVYAVFDLSANMTYLAPYANCGTNLQTITSSSNLEGMPGTCNAEGGSNSSTSAGASKTTSVATLQSSTMATGSPTDLVPSSATATGAAEGSSKSSAEGGDVSKGRAARNMGVNVRALGGVVAAMGLMLVF